jgi:predicted CoA-binding protein
MERTDGTGGWQNPPAAEIEQIVRRSKTVAVVGMSAKPEKASFQVAKYLMDQGYDVIPVNPAEKEILGKRVYPDLAAIGRAIDIVDVFRQADATPPIVQEAITIGARYIWLQEGIISEESYSLAQKAGVPIIMDKCIAKEHRRLKG